MECEEYLAQSAEKKKLDNEKENNKAPTNEVDLLDSGISSLQLSRVHKALDQE